MTSRVRRLPGLAALALALLALATLVVAPPAAGPPQVLTVPAADTGRFDPGNIISDEIFFDGRSMSAPEVQAFLDSKAPTCQPGADGTPCIKKYRQDTPAMPATAFCAAYQGARNESAADVIAKVGRACGVNPRVLLVLLQKEQSLITNTGSSLYRDRYVKATGFGCPDTADCDPAFGGFFYQVYNAARAFQNYRINAKNYRYRTGITNQIQFNPNTYCGSSGVYLANQATTGLYVYTPYQPNAAALRAGYGTGDSCSAYGNRNFWLYYTDWFGSTQHPGGGEVATRYAQAGGTNGELGAATSLITCGLKGGGCFQDYRNGSVHWSPSTGARMTKGWIGARWSAGGRENGVLGYPMTEEIALAGGVGQVFQGGTVYASPAGTFVVKGWVRDRYLALKAEAGFLGYPTSEEVKVSGGVRQSFSGGVIWSSAATGAHEVHGWVLDRYVASKAEAGSLGFPTSDEVSTSAGAYNTFTNGAIHSTPKTGAVAVYAALGRRWVALGAHKAAVGYPVAERRKAADGVGVYDTYSNGFIYDSKASGAKDVVGPIADKWVALGGVKSFLGYPTKTTATLAGGGMVSVFQGGSVYRAPGAAKAFEVHGWIRDRWLATGGPTGKALGYPTSDEVKAPDKVGVYQTFQRGVVYSSPKGGAHAVFGAVEDKWTALGGLKPFPGPPTSGELTMPDKKGKAWTFASGAAIYTSPATGPFEVHGWVRDLYSSLNGEQSFLGYPVSDETPILSGKAVVSRFQGGHIYSSAKTGAREVHGAILERYLKLGGPTSKLGLPTKNEYSVKGGRRSDFQGGTITCNTTTGKITVAYR